MSKQFFCMPHCQDLATQKNVVIGAECFSYAHAHMWLCEVKKADVHSTAEFSAVKECTCADSLAGAVAVSSSVLRPPWAGAGRLDPRSLVL